MIRNVMRAYQNRINNLVWMSDETKTKAIEKLNGLTIKIGYPDKWEDYSALIVNSPEEGGSYFLNAKNIAEWNWKKELEKQGKFPQLNPNL